MKKIIKTNSDVETISLGEKLGKLIKDENLVILLDGGLAAGKTTFTKGIAKGLGINEIIKSPTFTIMKTYEGKYNKLFHLDLYRLTETGMDFDLEDYILNEDGIVVIEWPNQVRDLLPDKYILINIINNYENRIFEISSKDYKEVIDKLWRHYF